MNPYRSTKVTCAICGARTGYHANWFLVFENQWLDRIRILSWHPCLATQKGVLCVCGKQHLKELIIHWLTEPDVRVWPEAPAFDLPLLEDRIGPEVAQPLCGRVVGELAIHREGRSRSWGGSQQMLDAILNALIGEPRRVRAAGDYSLPSLPADYIAEVALQ